MPVQLRSSHQARGFSLIGMLVTLTCMLVLSVIAMTALNKAVTGEGSTKDGTVRSIKDKMQLYALHQSMVVNAAELKGRFVTPGAMSLDEDRTLDTTANLFSIMVMNQYLPPESLVSANERSGYVWEMEDYDYRAYDPGAGVFWDSKFMADLEDLSNTSYAHMPLFGKRADRNWQPFGNRFPLIGNRGPKDGVHDPESWTYGKDGVWGGHVLFGDGHIAFLDTFTPNDVFLDRDGERVADNIFAIEDGPGGADAILSFTKKMTNDGPQLQFD